MGDQFYCRWPNISDSPHLSITRLKWRNIECFCKTHFLYYFKYQRLQFISVVSCLSTPNSYLESLWMGSQTDRQTCKQISEVMDMIFYFTALFLFHLAGCLWVLVFFFNQKPSCTNTINDREKVEEWINGSIMEMSSWNQVRYTAPASRAGGQRMW